MTGKTLLVTYIIKMKKQLLLTGNTSIIKLRKENRREEKNFISVLPARRIRQLPEKTGHSGLLTGIFFHIVIANAAKHSPDLPHLPSSRPVDSPESNDLPRVDNFPFKKQAISCWPGILELQIRGLY